MSEEGKWDKDRCYNCGRADPIPEVLAEREKRIKELEGDEAYQEVLDISMSVAKECMEHKANIKKLEAQIAEKDAALDKARELICKEYCSTNHEWHDFIDKALKSDGSQLLNAIGKARDVLDKTVTHWSKRKWNWHDEFEWTRIFQNTKEVLDSLKPYAGKK